MSATIGATIGSESPSGPASSISFTEVKHGCVRSVSRQAAQPVPLASLKLSMAVYGQKLDGQPSR